MSSVSISFLVYISCILSYDKSEVLSLVSVEVSFGKKRGGLLQSEGIFICVKIIMSSVTYRQRDRDPDLGTSDYKGFTYTSRVVVGLVKKGWSRERVYRWFHYSGLSMKLRE